LTLLHFVTACNSFVTAKNALEVLILLMFLIL